MSEAARRFFEVWCHKHLDYADNPAAAGGTPPEKASALIADAAGSGISQSELSDALGGNIQSAVFNEMMARSDLWASSQRSGDLN
ncbi:hypothetical protein [Methylobacterium sp. Leaf85]|uniref:hypothetical protein n=1 Tax=Methylobacterium sp. Leaf85 TaxID=1736241 RepID=UPI0012E88F29|nr:hypothetical protein [Methylobacterium sp. Leaf85]